MQAGAGFLLAVAAPLGCGIDLCSLWPVAGSPPRDWVQVIWFSSCWDFDEKCMLGLLEWFCIYCVSVAGMRFALCLVAMRWEGGSHCGPAEARAGWFEEELLGLALGSMHRHPRPTTVLKSTGCLCWGPSSKETRTAQQTNT